MRPASNRAERWKVSGTITVLGAASRSRQTPRSTRPAAKARPDKLGLANAGLEADNARNLFQAAGRLVEKDTKDPCRASAGAVER